MLWTRFDCASFHASADSLPPLPTSNIMRLRSSIEGKGKGLGGDVDKICGSCNLGRKDSIASSKLYLYSLCREK